MQSTLPRWKRALIGSDTAATIAGFLLAYWLRFSSGVLATPKGVPPLSQHLGYLLFVVVVWLLIFRACGLYRQRTQSPLDEAYSIVVGVGAGSVAVLGAVYWQGSDWYSRGLLILSAILTAALMLSGRLMLRARWQSDYARGQNRARAVLIGDDEDCARVERSLSPLWTGYEIAGRLPPPYEHSRGDGQLSVVSCQLSETWGDWDSLCAALNSNPPFEEIIVIGNCLRGRDVQTLADACNGANVVLRAVPDVLDLVKRAAPVEEIAGVPLLTLSSQPLSLPGRLAKRALDLCVVVPLAILLALPLAIIALLVKSSRGPVFYAQERCGQDGRPFRMLKFRSMREDAEAAGARWATRGDDRVTKIGRWLRRTSMDELPQLFNVLKGDMSLVGPRPERPVFVQQFGREIPRYNERHRMPVGITGWAQVNGLRGNTSVQDRTLYDLYYVENWSVALDVKILIKTACEVLFHRDAY